MTHPTPLADQLEEAVERMVRAQMTRFPPVWPEADRREMAMRDLFGRGEEE